MSSVIAIWSAAAGTAGVVVQSAGIVRHVIMRRCPGRTATGGGGAVESPVGGAAAAGQEVSVR